MRTRPTSSQTHTHTRLSRLQNHSTLAHLAKTCVLVQNIRVFLPILPLVRNRCPVLRIKHLCSSRRPIASTCTQRLNRAGAMDGRHGHDATATPSRRPCGAAATPPRRHRNASRWNALALSSKRSRNAHCIMVAPLCTSPQPRGGGDLGTQGPQRRHVVKRPHF